MQALRTFAVLAALALVGCSQNDTEITSRVRDRLASEGIADQVHVATTRRVVVLEGVVADRQELNRVEMAARATPGILGVDNRLVVQNAVNVTGGTLRQAAPSPAGPRSPAPPGGSNTAAAP